MSRIGWALLTLATVVPVSARADYLYSAVPDESRPRAMLIVDTSGSMNETDENLSDPASARCPYGADLGGECYSRLDAAKTVLSQNLQGNLEGLELGLMRFTTAGDPLSIRVPGATATYEPRECGICEIADPTTNTSILRGEIDTFVGNTWTPLGDSIRAAREKLVRVRNGEIDLDGDGVRDPDLAADCRPYFIIMLTDGEETCAPESHWMDPGSWPVEQIKEAMGVGIYTFVIGFGSEVTNSAQLTAMARAGGTAVDYAGDGSVTLSCWGSNGPCASGSNIFASDARGLDQALNSVMEVILTGEFTAAAPIAASVPFERSDVDRWPDNVRFEGTFTKRREDYAGHLYALRNYREIKVNGVPTGRTEGFDEMLIDLDDCGSNPDNACAYDAGRMLYDRVHAPAYPGGVSASVGLSRKIFTSRIASEARSDGTVTLTMGAPMPLTLQDGPQNLERTWGDFVGVNEVRSILADDLARPGDLPISVYGLADGTFSVEFDKWRKLVEYLHGVPARNDPAFDDAHRRDWPLGDIYHSSVAVVGVPPADRTALQYQRFQLALKDRPQIVYVGANDGMIHAFFAGPDLWEEPPRWQAGEELFAYFPTSQIVPALTALERGDRRFFSQDLSCRVEDVLVDPLQPVDDPYLGWRTLLVCGQGWGGSWYVGLDVTDPFNPRALWEFTDNSAVGGMGRTWSVPGVGLLNISDDPVWALVMGNGHNPDLRNCPSIDLSGNCAGATPSAPARILNYPYTGVFPQHGDGVTAADAATAYVVNFADGQLIERLSSLAGYRAITADVPTADTDANGLMDVAYAAGWSGDMGRIYFEGAGPASLTPETPITASDINACTLTTVSDYPLVSRPAAGTNPVLPDRVFLFAGSGIDRGRYPDEVRWGGGSGYDLRGYAYDDNGTAVPCGSPEYKGVPVAAAGNICTDGGSRETLELASGQSLTAGPFIFSDGTSTEMLYGAWEPPANACTVGTFRVLCRDVTNIDDCGLCDGFDEICFGAGCDKPTDEEPRLPPPLTIDSGGNPSIGGAPPGVNQKKRREPLPNTVTILSWREIF